MLTEDIDRTVRHEGYEVENPSARHAGATVARRFIKPRGRSNDIRMTTRAEIIACPSKRSMLQ
jgi:hypothetical protein